MNMSTQLPPPGMDPFSLTRLCRRLFPQREGLRVGRVQVLPSWQHHLAAFDLIWKEDGLPYGEGAVLCRYRSPISLWSVDDTGKAAREFGLLRRLRTAGVPAPRALASSDDGFGPYLLLGSVPGEAPDDLSEAVVLEAASTATRLHKLDLTEVQGQGLPQVSVAGVVAFLRRLGRQSGDKDLGRALTRLGKLAPELAEDHKVVLHGDLRPQHLVVAEERVLALTDWENAAVGDWRWDATAFAYRLTQTGQAELAALFLDTYARQGGHTLAPAELPSWYALLAVRDWALAAWLRARQEGTDPLPVPGAADWAAQTPELASAALTALKQAEA